MDACFICFLSILLELNIYDIVLKEGGGGGGGEYCAGAIVFIRF